MRPIAYGIITLLLSGLVATVVSFHLHRGYNELEVKRDVLRRFAGNRYLLTESRVGRDGEPFVALNEVFVVYADHPQVISAPRKMHEELGIQNRPSDNILTLTKAMATLRRCLFVI